MSKHLYEKQINFGDLRQFLLDDGLQLCGINRETPEQPKMRKRVRCNGVLKTSPDSLAQLLHRHLIFIVKPPEASLIQVELCAICALCHFHTKPGQINQHTEEFKRKGGLHDWNPFYLPGPLVFSDLSYLLSKVLAHSCLHLITTITINFRVLSTLNSHFIISMEKRTDFLGASWLMLSSSASSLGEMVRRSQPASASTSPVFLKLAPMTTVW